MGNRYTWRKKEIKEALVDSERSLSEERRGPAAVFLRSAPSAEPQKCQGRAPACFASFNVQSLVSLYILPGDVMKVSSRP
jgi:hypothetical protein